MVRTTKKVEKAPEEKLMEQDTTWLDPETLVDGQEDQLAELLALAEAEKTVRPIVRKFPPNFRLVICDVGPHPNVRVMVRPNNRNYIPRMEIPLDIDLDTFDPNGLLVYNGDPPRRKGMW